MSTHWYPGNADLPASGVTAGTYGDATHVGRVTVNAAGLITAASSVGITGGGGGGTELDYVPQATDLTVTATSAATAQTFLIGNAITYDGATRVKLEFWSPNVSNVAGNVIILELFDGVTDLGRLGQSAGNAPYYGVVFLTPSAAAHTYTVTAHTSSTTGSPTVDATPGGTGVVVPAFCRFTKV